MPELPKVKAPVLMFHGLDDTALHSDGLVRHLELGGEGPDARDGSRRRATSSSRTRRELVTTTMKWWLTMRAR